MNRRPLWILLGLALLGGCAYAIATRLERRVVREPFGPSARARANPLLACALTFEKLGLPTRELDLSAGLPPPADTLFLSITPTPLPAQQREQLAAWVENGGELVLFLPSDPPLAEAVLRSFARNPGVLPVVDSFELELRQVSVRRGEDSEPVHILADDESKDWQLRLDADTRRNSVKQGLRLIDDASEADQSWSDEHGGWMCRFDQGAGCVFVVAEDAWIRNEGFGQLDHAAVAWSIARAADARQGCWIAWRAHSPGLLAWLATHAWPALIAGLLALAAFVWRRGTRFGPLLPDQARETRDFAEHVRASGRCLAEHGGREALLGALERVALRRARRRWPELAQRDRDALADELAQRLQVDPARARAALALHSKSRPEALVSTVSLLQRIARS